ASLAPSAGMHLGLDDPEVTAELFGALDGFVGCLRGHALWNGNAIVGEQPLGLVFVQIHLVDFLLPGGEVGVFWRKAQADAKPPPGEASRPHLHDNPTCPAYYCAGVNLLNLKLTTAFMAQATAVDRGAPPGDTVRLRAFDNIELTWRVLGTLNVFRLVVPVVLLLLFLAGSDGRIFGERYPDLFATTAVAYLLFAILSAAAIRQRWLPAVPQAVAHIIVDLAAVITLMHASGGIASGLGGLLIVFVGAGSLVLPGQLPAFFAAVATLALLSEQLFSQLAGAI